MWKSGKWNGCKAGSHSGTKAPASIDGCHNETFAYSPTHLQGSSETRVKNFVVITSISSPNPALRAYAKGCGENGWNLIVVGDTKSPTDFLLSGCDFYSIDRQATLDLAYARLCPTGHYARKNIGYLLAIRAGAEVIRDTDDDNLPREGFWSPSAPEITAPSCVQTGWVNVYRWFSDALIWPRGLPLDQIHAAVPEYASLPVRPGHCPIQQGLADENPDVDAIYRLVLPLPQNFHSDRRVALGPGSWCPFNSQNTTWHREAFPLLYLPAYCSFRMTDIWRSFVAQRIAWANGWSILFHQATVYQERNWHDLMRDFAEEVPGYLHNAAIARELEALPIRPGREALGGNLRLCYEKLCEMQCVDSRELPLLDAWLEFFAFH